MSAKTSPLSGPGTDEQRSQRFLLACARQPTDVTPVWMMRQAGRTMPAYRELRKKHSFLELAAQPDLMTQVTLMPIDTLGVDAAVLFADITLPLTSLGVGFDIVESVGPVVESPVTTREQVDALSRVPVAETVPAVFETVRLLRKELEGRVPVIGFAGAPFTLACYVVEGKRSKDLTGPKTMMFRDPDTWHALMDRLTELTIEYLQAQIDAGAQAVQLFDSWLGGLSPQDAEAHVLGYTRKIFDALSAAGVPRIAFGTDTATLLESIAATGCDVVSVDWRINLDDAWKRIGYDKGIQGNLEPAVLLGPPDVVRSRALDVLRRAGGRPGHVFNLGHGVLPQTPVDNLKLLVDTVHSYTP